MVANHYICCAALHDRHCQHHACIMIESWLIRTGLKVTPSDQQHNLLPPPHTKHPANGAHPAITGSCMGWCIASIRMLSMQFKCLVSTLLLQLQ